MRGSLYGKPLTEYEYRLLYERAMTGSVKDASHSLGRNHNSVHHTTARIFEKLGVEDFVSAMRKIGWLRPVPYEEKPITRYIVVDGNGDWVELDSSTMIVEVTDEWFREHELESLDAECSEYEGGVTEGILKHWHVEDVFTHYLSK